MNVDFMQEERVLLVERDEDIVTLTLNRPAQYNALSRALLEALRAALTELAGDPNVRVIILTGSGKAFCAGHDLKELQAIRDRAEHKALFELCSEVMLQITRQPQPVIAQVNGLATAAGCQLVATCDLAVAAEDARFATSGIALGFFCGTPGVAVSRVLARKHALEMLFTGRFLGAGEALAKGLINLGTLVESLREETLNLARVIAAKPAFAIQQGKQLFYRQLEANLEEAYALASEFMVCNLAEPETQEGIDAFIQKRPPAWQAARRPTPGLA